MLPIALMLATPACGENPVRPVQSPPGNTLEVAGRTDISNKKGTNLGPGFSLMVVESVDLPLSYVKAIADFYPFDGAARLRDGGCIRLLRKQPGKNDPPDRVLTGARIALNPVLCLDVPPPGEGIRANPCPGDALGSPLAGWYLSCQHLAGGRSALIAIGSGSATKGRKITLAVLDQRIRFFHLFGIHWNGGVVTTLATNRDGTTLISKYSWYAVATGK